MTPGCARDRGLAVIPPAHRPVRHPEVPVAAVPAGGARENGRVRHASLPDPDRTDLIDRADAGRTSHLSASPALGTEIRPVVPCPFHGHWAAWKLARRIALVLAYATFAVWGWGLFLAAWVLHGLAWP